MPLTCLLELDRRPGTFDRYEQLALEALAAASRNEGGFIVGLRGREVVVRNLHNERSEIEKLSSVARRDPEVRAVFDGGYERFLASIVQSRHGAKTLEVESALAGERGRGVPLTSRRIREVEGFLCGGMPIPPFRDDAPAGGSVPESLPPPDPKQSYGSQWRLFVRWCGDRDEGHWPASDETVAAYLKSRAEHCGIKTLRVARTAISNTHRAAGLGDPCATDLVKATMKGLSRPRAERIERAASGVSAFFVAIPRAGESAHVPARIICLSTLRSYACHWRKFDSWCVWQGVRPFPASDEAIAEYLRHLAVFGNMQRVMMGRTAIAHVHRTAGLANPCDSRLVKQTVQRLRQAATPSRESSMPPNSPPGVPRRIDRHIGVDGQQVVQANDVVAVPVRQHHEV